MTFIWECAVFIWECAWLLWICLCLASPLFAIQDYLNRDEPK